MSRRKTRDAAFKVLFQVDLVNADVNEAIKILGEEFKLVDNQFEFLTQLVHGTLQHQTEIDERITRFSPEWQLERMGAVDRNLLRMATYEIVYEQDVHPVVAINEAVELAKRYGDDNSKNFINAILDRIREENQ
ncbi:MAG: transcription antitermination factor NusB [Ignavibacteriales bacterium]